MKRLNISFTSNRLMRKLATYLAATATVAMAGLAASVWLGRADAAEHHEQRDSDRRADEWLLATYDEAQVAELNQLLADYHGALAYGGNITAMASLWAEDSTLTLNNGTPYVGKTAVLGFFTSSPYFSHNWVSLAPEWKTTITVHGTTAEATTECIATDPVANVIKGVIQVNVIAEQRHGKWVFISMDNFTEPQI